MKIEQQILDRATTWMSSPFDEQTREEVEKLLTSDPKTLEESFYKNLEFGTGGMRGVMGVGTNRINQYTLGKNTQGISNYLHKVYPNQTIKVVIAYDCRHQSDTLAKVVADIFTANNIRVYLHPALRTTPQLSFAIKHLESQLGIVLTASHNPPEYNGYKVYWQDGGQIVPPEDEEIIEAIEAIDYNDIKFEAQPSLLTILDHNIDEAFWQSALASSKLNLSQQAREQFKVVFTSLHGTSITAIPQVLSKAGYSDLHIVKEQAEPDGNFSTVKSPNPEEPEALTLALALADQVNADIVVGTDPDSDRLGVAVRNNAGQMILLNGNQTMVLMTAFLLEQWQKDSKITGKEFVGTTIVSTPMMHELAEAYGVECKVGLTGFKWIAKFIKDFPELTFIGGGEESFGYMVGDAVRDKDAVAATLLICEIGAYAKQQGSSIYEELLKLYQKFGLYKEYLISITKKGIEGAKAIDQMMHDWRTNPLKEIARVRVVMLEDYQTSTALNLTNKQTETLNIPKSNVLIYYLEDGTKICARPSGTEPKIKFYFSVNTKLDNTAEFEQTNENLQHKINQFIKALKIA